MRLPAHRAAGAGDNSATGEVRWESVAHEIGPSAGQGLGTERAVPPSECFLESSRLDLRALEGGVSPAALWSRPGDLRGLSPGPPGVLSPVPRRGQQALCHRRGLSLAASRRRWRIGLTPTYI